MKLKILPLMIILILFIAGRKDKPETFNLIGFEKTLSRIDENFYMSKYETTNLQYRTFLEDLKNSGDKEQYALAKVDTARWIDSLGANRPYAGLYDCHPAYNNYPVVNISYEGAVLFCKWMTDKYNIYEKRKFKKVKFRLPSHEEWERAARGGLKDADYPWGFIYLTNYKGQQMCNYLIIGDESIHYDENKDTYVIADWGTTGKVNPNRLADISVPVNSFQGNGFDIYNISGNVTEMIADKGIARGGSWISPGYDVRIESVDNYTHPDVYIGFRYCMEVIEN